MTRIAVLADIHGNLPALEAVAEDLLRQRVDEVLVGGDLVGRGPQGSSVVAAVRASGWRAVRGNHEDYLVAFRDRSVPEAWLHDPEWSAARWMADELGADGAEHARGLPFDLRAHASGDVRVVHGSPRSNQEGLGPWSTEAEILGHMASVAEPVLVCAHTHRPHIRRLDGRLVVNAGSVGLPFDGDWHARYAILTRDAGGWRAEHRRVPWDRGRFLELYRSSGFLDAGGVTAALLEMEVLTARSQLVPFLEWVARREVAPDWEALARFRTARAAEPDAALREAG